MGLFKQLVLVAALGGLGVAAYQYVWPLVAPADGRQAAEGRRGGQAAQGRRGGDRAVTVLVKTVELRAERTRIKAVGTARAYRSVTLHPAAAGEVAAVHFAPDQKVRKGAVLLELHSRREKLAVDLARVRVRNARQLLSRYERSAGSGAYAESTVADARGALDEAEIALRQAEVSLSDRRVIAPFDGFVTRVVERLNERFAEVEITLIADDATFIRGSVREVVITLSIAVAIVVATIWLFIGSLRATLIPTVAIPLALIGTVAAIWLIGFSINLLTLLALVLATGMIVDDSIVVLENIQRRRGPGLASRAAAVVGTRQVFFAVVATTVTLVSVFIPISFLPSAAGRLFREFGFVLAIAVSISSFVALSLVPALAARLPEGPPARRRWITALGRWLAGLYARTLRLALNAPVVAGAVALAFGAFAWGLFGILDEELIPPEDRGVLRVFATGPDGVSLGYSDRQADRIEEILQPYVDSGEVERVLTTVGRWDLNRVFAVAPLAPWDQRARSQQEIMRELRRSMSQIPGARVSVYSPNSLGLRSSSATGVEVALIGTDYERIFEAAQAFARGIEDELPNLSDPDISYQPTQPQLSVHLDRRRASDLGLPLDDIAATLRAMIDGDEIADLNVDDQAIPILLEAEGGAINDPTDLVNLHVRSTAGALVPLSSVATITEEGVAAELDRHRQHRAVEVDADTAIGYPLRDAVEDLKDLAERLLPPDVEMILLGEAEALEETSREVALTYAVALIVVFLVLTAQFESFMSAAVIMATVPFGLAAAVLAMFLTGTSINIYSQIGLVMLIGIMAKNGILVVEFAEQLRDRGLAVREAIETAARVRLRPIVMTMVSTVLGGLPLILSGGPGGEARAAIGWVVFGGLGLAALFTLYLTPVAYLALARFAKPRAAEGARLERELRDAASVPDRASVRPAE